VERVFHGLVDVRLQLDNLAAAPAAVRRYDKFCLTIINSVLERFRAETAENDGVNRSHPRTGEHGNHRFGNHWHVDGDAIALSYAHVVKRVCPTAHVEVQLLVGDGSDITGFAFENQRGLVLAIGTEMPVDAVFGDIEFPADEPLGEGSLPFEDLAVRLAPDQMFLRLAVPEFLWGVDRLAVEPFVGRITPKIGLGFELGRRPEFPGFPGY